MQKGVRAEAFSAKAIRWCDDLYARRDVISPKREPMHHAVASLIAAMNSTDGAVGKNRGRVVEESKRKARDHVTIPSLILIPPHQVHVLSYIY